MKSSNCSLLAAHIERLASYGILQLSTHTVGPSVIPNNETASVAVSIFIT